MVKVIRGIGPGWMITLLLLGFMAIGAVGTPAAWAEDGVQSVLNRGAAYLCRPEFDGSPAWKAIALRAADRLDPESGPDAAVLEPDDATTSRALALIAMRAHGAAEDDPVVGELVAQLQDCQLPGGKFADSIYGEGEILINAHLWAIIALRAAGVAIPDEESAYRWLAAQQFADGGFSYAVGLDAPDADMTAMALQALAAIGAGEDDPVVRRALDYLRNHQSEGGGFGAWGLEVTADTCAAVIMGLIAQGIDPTSPEWNKNGGNPVTALCSLQLPGGGFEYAAGLGPNAMSTQQAVLALADLLAGRPFWTRFDTVTEPQFDDEADSRRAGAARFVLLKNAVISGCPALSVGMQLFPESAGVFARG